MKPRQDIGDALRHVVLGSDLEIARTDLHLGDEPLEVRDFDELEALRPRTRGDCSRIAGPCPFVGCRHHFGIDVSEGGEVRVASVFARLYRNCALDFADKNPDGATLEEVGRELLLTRERVRQIETQATRKLAMTADELKKDGG